MNLGMQIFWDFETFLDSSVDDETLHIPSYHFEQNDRTRTDNMMGKSKGGGILIYLTNHLISKQELILKLLK